MVRKLYSLAIVAFFAIMMTFLWKDHLLPGMRRSPGIEVDRRVLMDSWVNQNDYYALSLDTMPLGIIRSTAERDNLEGEEETYSTGAHLEVDVAFFRARVMLSARLNRRLELESGRLRAHLPTLGQPLLSPEELDAEELPRGVYEAAVLARGSNLHLRLRRDGAVQYRQISLTRPVTMTESIAPILRGEMMTMGQVYSMDIYEPMFGGSAGQVQLEWVENQQELDGNVIREFRVVELRYQNVTTRLFVDESGNIARREIPLFAGGSDAAGGRLPGTRLIMRALEPQDVLTDHPQLMYIPEPPEYTFAEFQGRDTGQVINLTLFSILAGGLRERTP